MAKRKAVAIGGVPCSGKTTLMKAILSIVEPKDMFKFGLLRGYLKEKVAILGIYNKKDTFGGTDKLSMAVQKHYERFLNELDYNILFEGDRLFTKNNVLYLQENFDCKNILLENDEQVLNQRHTDRNDTQSQKFKKSRKTKINNIKNNNSIRLEVFQLNAIKEAEKLADDIVTFLF